MARSNTANTANYFTSSDTGGLPTANPISMSCWFYPFNLTSTSCLMAIGNAGATSYHALLFDGANAYAAGDNKVIIDNSSAFASSSGAVANANEWNHACSVNASITSRIAYLNGVAGTTNTTSVSASSYNHMDLACIRSTTTTFNPLDGRMCEAAVWNVALTADEVTALSKGVAPWLIRPNNLARYNPMFGLGEERDRIRRALFTENGTMARAEHVRQFYPTGPVLIGLGTSGGAANAVGTAAGTATADATGAATKEASGSSAGVATAAATSAATATSSGTIAGLSTAAATGVSSAASSGTIAGVATAAATGIATKAAAGSSAGIATAAATGTATAASAGSAAGTSTAAAASDTSGSIGTAAGTSTVAGISASTAAAVGSAAGTSNVIAFSGTTQPGIPNTGGSGNASHGAGRGRNINDDPDRFSELLKEWRARKEAPESLNIPDATHIPAARIPKATRTAADEDDTADELLEQVKRIEAAFDRSMLAYEAALAKVERAMAAKAQKAAIAQEEQARQQAMQLAIEWELARLAYEDFLEDEDEIMLLTAA